MTDMYDLYSQAQLDEAVTEEGLEVRQHDVSAAYGRDGAMDHQSDAFTSWGDDLVHWWDELPGVGSSTVAIRSHLTDEVRMFWFLLAICSMNLFPPRIFLLVVGTRILNR
jgi:hypothetical protein